MAFEKKRDANVRLRAVASAAIVLLHIMMGMWLAQDRAAQLITPSPIINIDLSPGPGVGSRPTLSEPSEQSEKGPALRAAPEPEDEVDETAAPPMATENAPTAEPTSPTLIEAANDTQPQMPSPSMEGDILRQVEALIGTTASDLAVDNVQVDLAIAEGWTASQPGGGGGCDLTEIIRAKLMADQPAVLELVSYPISQRSVSNAIQLWNGEWSSGPTGNDATHLQAVRKVISATVLEASDDCRNRLLQGPRFVLLTPPDVSPIILVIGSGDWQWAELTVPDELRFFRWFGLKRDPY